MQESSNKASISLVDVNDKNIKKLKMLNLVIFPLPFNDDYYNTVLASGEFSKLAYYGDECVGSIACKLEKKEDGGVRLYILTFGVLAPYRCLGIGSKLLTHVLDMCSKQTIGEIYLNVQTNNDEAISFYKKFGFEITDTIRNYYKHISPPDCHVLTKLVTETKAA